MTIRIAKSATAAPRTNPRPKAPGSQRRRQRDFFTAAELAERWGVSVRHIRRLIDCGELIAHKFGRSVRISFANVLAYEAKCTAVT